MKRRSWFSDMKALRLFVVAIVLAMGGTIIFFQQTGTFHLAADVQQTTVSIGTEEQTQVTFYRTEGDEPLIRIEPIDGSEPRVLVGNVIVMVDPESPIMIHADGDITLTSLDGKTEEYPTTQSMTYVDDGTTVTFTTPTYLGDPEGPEITTTVRVMVDSETTSTVTVVPSQGNEATPSITIGDDEGTSMSTPLVTADQVVTEGRATVVIAAPETTKPIVINYTITIDGVVVVGIEPPTPPTATIVPSDGDEGITFVSPVVITVNGTTQLTPPMVTEEDDVYTFRIVPTPDGNIIVATTTGDPGTGHPSAPLQPPLPTVTYPEGCNPDLDAPSLTYSFPPMVMGDTDATGFIQIESGQTHTVFLTYVGMLSGRTISAYVSGLPFTVTPEDATTYGEILVDLPSPYCGDLQITIDHGFEDTMHLTVEYAIPGHDPTVLEEFWLPVFEPALIQDDYSERDFVPVTFE